MFSSAGANVLALHIDNHKKSSDDRPRCLENSRPAGAESTLTENVASPFHAEPRHHDHAPVPVSILPKPEEKSGQDNYWIMISAQNGTVSESLWFRVRKDGKLPWAYSYLVTKHLTLRKRRGPIPKGAQLMEPILRKLWSDEVETAH